MPLDCAIPQQDGVMMGRLMARIEKLRACRSAWSSYNIDMMTLGIDVYSLHGYVLKNLERLQEALSSFQKSLELGYKVVDGLKQDNPKVENA